MTKLVLTSPAIDMHTGLRGTLVLEDGGALKRRDRGDGVLLQMVDSEQLGADGHTSNRTVRLSDVECLEITPQDSDGSYLGGIAVDSVMTLHLKDGSAATFSLLHCSPTLLRRVFLEVGWSRLCGRTNYQSREAMVANSSINLATS